MPSYKPLITLRGHTSTVYSVAFAERQYLASGSLDNTVKVWDLSAGREKKTFSDHLASVSTVTFSPLHGWLATGSNDHQVMLWTQLFRRFLGIGSRMKMDLHAGAVYSVTFTPDERWLISAGTDNAVRIADLKNNRAPLIWLRAHTGHIYQVAVSADARWLAVASMDNTISLWNLPDVLARKATEPIIYLRGHTDGVTSVAFSPDSLSLASGSYDNSVKLWDLSMLPYDLTTLRYAAPATLRFHDDCVQSVVFSPDGAQLASASSDCTVRVYRIARPRPFPIAKLALHRDKVHTIAFSRDSAMLASGSRDNTVIVWGAA